MASAIFKPSRIIAIAIVGGAALWIASGVLGSSEDPTSVETSEAPTVPILKVAVETVSPEEHGRSILVSCVTEADHRAVAVARGAGVLTGLLVAPGAAVSAGEIIALISDEGRDSAVKEAEALVAQRNAEYDANKRLIDQGTAPRNTLPGLEAAVAAAEATLAAAQAEAEKLEIKSPIDGIVDSVPIRVGQAVQYGSAIAEIIDPDPMLAVGSVSEFERGSLRVGQDVSIRFVEGSPVSGKVHFISLSAEPATRTYDVEATMANPNAEIADGLTCEMTITLEPIEAVSVPRSSLVFSDEGRLGVRIVDHDDRVRFKPIEIVDDHHTSAWVTGMNGPVRLIVTGQDFVKEGDPVEPVSAAETDDAAGPQA